MAPAWRTAVSPNARAERTSRGRVDSSVGLGWDVTGTDAYGALHCGAVRLRLEVSAQTVGSCSRIRVSVTRGGFMIGGRELRAAAVTVAGWVLVVAGVAALILPGPGLLLLLAGLILLSQRYEWAASRVEPVKEKAFGMAKAGVASVPRILLSATGAAALIAVGIIWWIDPRIPEIGPIGPDLPLGGWTTGISVIVSGVVAAALLLYSIRRWRGEAVAHE